LKQIRENDTVLTPIHTTKSYLTDEELKSYDVEPQTVNRPTVRFRNDSVPPVKTRRKTLTELFNSNVSQSVEEIMAARKEISAHILAAESNAIRNQDHSFRYFALKMTHSKPFNRMMLFVILVNVLSIAFQNETTEIYKYYELFSILSDIFTTIYTLEFAIKFYADRSRYWLSLYNMFDFSILIVAYIDVLLAVTSAEGNNKLASSMRSLRAFRALKIVNFLPGVQVIASALVETLKQLIVDVILLLILLLFAFGVMGFYFFGYGAVNERILETWGSLSAVFLTLFTVVTADSWWKFIEELVYEGGHSLAYSRTYIVTFLFFGHFITANLFIAVIITNIQSSSNDFKAKEEMERGILIHDRKKEYWNRSRREVKRLMSSTKLLNGECNFNEVATDFYYSLQKRDFVVKSDLKTNILWIDTVCKELSRSIKSNRKCLYLQRSMVESIAPVCSLSEVDRRKVSISTDMRYVVKHKLTGLEYLTRTFSTGGKTRKNSLNMPKNDNLNAPRLSIFRRKSKLG